MRTAVPEKILKIIADIGAQGNVPLTRLTVLKKWFEVPGRLSVFGLWVARRAAASKGRTSREHRDLLNEARKLLGAASTRASLFQPIDLKAAKDLHHRARLAQNEFQSQQWGPVRIVPCWPLMLVETGLALHAGLARHPSDGYKLAADWMQHYDSRYGNGLNGPSRAKLQELVRFVINIEAQGGTAMNQELPLEGQSVAPIITNDLEPLAHADEAPCL